jgi:outer membrane protein TolC
VNLTRTAFALVVTAAAFGQQLQPLKEIEIQPRIGIMGRAPVSLHEVIERVLSNDPELRVSRIEKEEASYNIRAAQGLYDPTLGLKAFHTKAVTPVSSVLGGSADGKLTQREWNATPQLSGLFPAGGGTYSLSFANSRQSSDNQFLSLNPIYPESVTLNLTQPLWRGLRFDENRHRLQVARKNDRLTAEQLRQVVIQAVSQAVSAYWELDYAVRNYDVQTQAVHLAERQYESNRRQAEQGLLAPIDVTAAQTQVATFQQSVFLAQQALTQAENNLKAIMLPNRTDLLWGMALVPETQLTTEVKLPSLEAAVQEALKSRPELAENSLQIDINRLDARLSGELAKPRIDAFVNATAAGLSGRQVPQTASPFASLFPAGFGQTPALLIGSYGQSLSNLADGTFPTLQAGVQISLPLRNRTAQANVAISAAEGRRLTALKDQIGMAIEVDVRNSLQSVTSAQSRLDAAVLARRSAEEQYASEQRQFEAGTSSTFLVLQRQTDFITARSREVRAHADLGEAIVNLDRATARTIDAQGINLEKQQ